MRQAQDGGWHYVCATEGKYRARPDKQDTCRLHRRPRRDPPGGAATIAGGGGANLPIAPATGTPEQQQRWLRDAYMAAMPLVDGFGCWCRSTPASAATPATATETHTSTRQLLRRAKAAGPRRCNLPSTARCAAAAASRATHTPRRGCAPSPSRTRR